ncbi:hypothetical protein J2S09_004085 [Bacillus fengqiuensis]|nr:hypothetical protein [Bacillus fengqiuensis]
MCELPLSLRTPYYPTHIGNQVFIYCDTINEKIEGYEKYGSYPCG